MILEEVFDMTNVIQTQAIDSSILDQTEIALVDGVSKTGDLIKNHAVSMCKVFNIMDITGTKIITPWYELRGKDAKGIKARRASFVTRMIARGHTDGLDKDGNPKPSATVDTYWSRVKKESGHVPNGKVSGGTNDVDAKTATELKTMINRILKSEEDGKDCHASTILEALKDAHIVLTGEAFNAKK
jgi:hypothetical protein